MIGNLHFHIAYIFIVISDLALESFWLNSALFLSSFDSAVEFGVISTSDIGNAESPKHMSLETPYRVSHQTFDRSQHDESSLEH